MVKLTIPSAKVRTGPPVDDEEDYALPVWAGQIPLRTIAAQPIADPRLDHGVEPPLYAVNYTRAAGRESPPGEYSNAEEGT